MRKFAVLDVEQGSPEWFAARVGRVTSSTAKAVTMKGRGKEESVTKRDLMLRLAIERITQQPLDDDGPKTEHMERGTAMQPEAFAAYEAITGTVVHRSGFLSHHELMIGASLDGHMGDFEGVLEMKCPKSSTHLRYIREGRLPTDYINQVAHQLLVTGADYCDFFSYDPRFPVELQAFCIRVSPADVDMVGYEMALRGFLTDVESEVKAVQAMRAAKAAA